ncbi:MAG TPA: hypothetical protein PLG05_05330 [Bacteroidales bacterium]|nr:hypothetical protein [Bacteroidales bacterium]HOR60126.1 hypothetical protein [Bacteroidales bacterium]HPL04579.1 hypothetical protein [Bacteroidales bacterium]
MSNHNEFILKPIVNVLNEGVNACLGIGCGIETYPLYDYISQSLFLKMTGFQEQKMKCICWELASNDYDYRRILLSNEDRLGECSSYEDKTKIYKRLVEQICNYDCNFNATTIDKKKILTTLKIDKMFSNTNFVSWSQVAFNNFKNIWRKIEVKHFVTDNQSLFPEITNGISLKIIYKNHLYKHRNKIAHNTHSYQQNLPTLKTLLDENYKYENYFLWFAILVLIDNIFIELYKKYLTIIEDN